MVNALLLIGWLTTSKVCMENINILPPAAAQECRIKTAQVQAIAQGATYWGLVDYESQVMPTQLNPMYVIYWKSQDPHN